MILPEPGARAGAAGTVTITTATDYPFSGQVSLTVAPSVNRLKFPLLLRIPAWAEGASGVCCWSSWSG